MSKKKKDKFALYLDIKKQQRACSKYLESMKKEVELLNECAAEMA